jgi:hypothetical protein
MSASGSFVQGKSMGFKERQQARQLQNEEELSISLYATLKTGVADGAL